MDYFRNIVVVAALAGAIAGLGMTIAQQLTTVPLILKAEVYEEQSATPAHDHGDAAAAQAGAHEHGDGGWAPADGFERTVFSRPRQYRHRHRLRAAAGRGERAVRRHQGLAPGCVLGAGRLCRVHARARPWTSARASGHAGGRAWRAPALVGGDRALARRSRSACWSIGRSRSRPSRRSPCWWRRI